MSASPPTRSEPLAAQAWSHGLLADTLGDGAAGLWSEAMPLRLPPTLHADAVGTMWLLDRHGTLIRGRGRGAGWERVHAPVQPIIGLAPHTDGGAVILAPQGAGFELVGMARDGHARWRRASHDLAMSQPMLDRSQPLLLQDDEGQAYLHARAGSSSLWRVNAATGALDLVATLEGYDASVRVWQGAVWRIQFDGEHRQWLRRPFGAGDQLVLGGGTLDDSFLTAIAVGPQQGPVLTDGSRIVALAPGGQERAIALPQLPAPAPPGPAVLDLLCALPRPGALWAVYADGAGWSVHALPLG